MMNDDYHHHRYKSCIQSLIVRFKFSIRSKKIHKMIKNDIYIIIVGKIDFRNKKKFPVNRMPEFDFFFLIQS